MIIFKRPCLERNPGFDNGSLGLRSAVSSDPVWPMGGRRLGIISVSVSRCDRAHDGEMSTRYLCAFKRRRNNLVKRSSYPPVRFSSPANLSLVRKYSVRMSISSHGKWIRSTTFNTATGMSRDLISGASNGQDRNSNANRYWPAPEPDFDDYYHFDCFDFVLWINNLSNLKVVYRAQQLDNGPSPLRMQGACMLFFFFFLPLNLSILLCTV